MNINKIVKNVLTEAAKLRNSMVLTEEVDITDNLKYHINNQIPLFENVFRSHSDAFFDLINEVRFLYENGMIELSEKDVEIVESDLGKKVQLPNGKEIYLDIPVIEENLNEAEYQGRKVQLGKIMQGDIKKFKVYVKNDKGKVVKVNFGFGGKSAKGKIMRIKMNNPERRKSYRARHNCDNPGPRWKPRYWACRTW